MYIAVHFFILKFYVYLSYFSTKGSITPNDFTRIMVMLQYYFKILDLKIEFTMTLFILFYHFS